MIPLRLLASIVIIIFSFILALQKRQRFSKSIRIFTIGLLFSIFVVITLPENTNGIMRFFLTLQTGTLDADYEYIFSSLPKNAFYITFVKFLCFLSPLCFGGFILSFFEKYIDGLIFYLQRKRKDVFIFSDYSEINLSLAKEIRDNEKNALIVFRNIEITNDSYEKIKEYGFLVLSWTDKKMVFRTAKKCFFIQFSDSEVENINNTLSIFNLIQAKKIIPKKANIKFFVKIKEKNSELIFDSCNKGLIEIKIINYENEIAKNFFFANPMLQYLDNSNELLIIGNNNLFIDITKSAVIFSQFGDKKVIKINAISDEHNVSKLISQWPSINSKQYNLNLLKSPFDIHSLTNRLSQIGKKLGAIILCIDDYQTSFEIALFLRKYYVKMNLQDEYYPSIFIYSEKDLKSVFSNTQNKNSHLYKINSFGSYSNVYSYKNIFNNEIDNIALNIHATYMTTHDKAKILESFYSEEINRKSCINNAIHLTYKLNYLGFKLSKNNHISIPKINNLLLSLQDESIQYDLGKIEHQRWVAFQESEGWTGANFNEVIQYSRYTKSHKYPSAKLHGCICSWDDLDLLGNHFGIDFKELDIRFVLKLPYILGITDNTQINISNIHNTIEEM